jgi:hypothetical protein
LHSVCKNWYSLCSGQCIKLPDVGRVNHYCLRNSSRKKIFRVLLSRRSTFIAITATWFIIDLSLVERRLQVTQKSVHFELRCLGLLQSKLTIPFNVLLYIALVATIIINYRIYKSVAGWLKEHTDVVYKHRHVISNLRSVRILLIMTVWLSINLWLRLLMRLIIIYYKCKLLYYAKVVTNGILVLTVQLNALIAQVVTGRRSRKRFWSLFPWHRVSDKRRRRLVGVAAERPVTNGIYHSGQN